MWEECAVTIEDAIQDKRDEVLRIAANHGAHDLRVFGSAARGDPGPHSDIDLLVVVPPGTHRRDTARGIYRALAHVGFAVDVIVVTTEDVSRYRHAPGTVISSALAEGRELYAA